MPPLRPSMRLDSRPSCAAAAGRSAAYAREEWSVSATWALLPLPRCGSVGMGGPSSSPLPLFAQPSTPRDVPPRLSSQAASAAARSPSSHAAHQRRARPTSRDPDPLMR
jgi:hypothetical protein